jgi:hypothetical protein
MWYFAAYVVNDVRIYDTVEKELANRTPEIAVNGRKRPTRIAPFAVAI